MRQPYYCQLVHSYLEDVQVSVTEAKNKLTQLIAAVEKGERVTIVRRGHPVAEIVQPTRRAPKFGGLRAELV